MSDISKREEEILEFWEQNQVFEKSVAQRPEDKPYVFYDGPPFATGLPHYGNLVASLLKDIVPRYWTMKGYRVERVWGWDCHGLPIENIIEEKLGLKTKKDIDDYGIGKFNAACRSSVLTFASEWKKTIRRFGRWVDMENAYNTMDLPYMESVWWVFSEIWKKGLIYEGKKAMHICPRCVTPLSNFEVTQGYKEIKDISATVKFLLTNAKEMIGVDGAVYLLAWTTTPWTLPGNVLLAVGEDIEYALLEGEGAHILVAKERVAVVIDTKPYTVVKEFKGVDLVGCAYEPLFPYFKDTAGAFRVVAADFVSTDEGTGVVHIAPAFGQDDYLVGEREQVEFIQHVAMDGTFAPDVIDFAGMQVKPKDDPSKTDIEIIKWLAHNGKLFSKEKIEHSYPHCWRCDTPLLNYATSSWFLRVTEIKDDLLVANQKTSWVPDHMRDGRFGKWLENARDWAISRNRFWGAPLPIWKSEDGDVLCIGSVAELEALSGQSVVDLHKDVVDDILIEQNGKIYRRIPEVLDCWFESGSMPYGQMHYPFENKEKFERGFPAEFIAEGQDQTRGWFYTLHVLANALTRGSHPSIPSAQVVPAFRNVIVNGILLAEDGKKMSKKLKNYPDPMHIISQYGADALRWYLASSPAMVAENLNFLESGVREMSNKCVNTIWNVLQFYEMFADGHPESSVGTTSKHVLDRWILSRLNNCLASVTRDMNEYEISSATRPMLEFVSDCSQWYVRRSRNRFKSDDAREQGEAQETLNTVLHLLSRVIAPFMPFLAEMVYQKITNYGLRITDCESVHLETWPDVDERQIDTVLEADMESVRKIVEMAHALRSESGMKVRQPLSVLVCSKRVSDELVALIKDEVNIKEVRVGTEAPQGKEWIVKENGPLRIALNTALSQELKDEGIVRDCIRSINALRKERGLTPKDIIVLEWDTDSTDLARILTAHIGEIAASVISGEMVRRTGDDMQELALGEGVLRLALRAHQKTILV